MKTVRIFFEIQTQKLEVLQRKLLKQMCCLPLWHNYCLQLWFHGANDIKFETMVLIS